MTCKQLGGACDHEFKENSFDEFTEQIKAHGMDMFQKQDPDHLEAIQKIQRLMINPEEFKNGLKVKGKNLKLYRKINIFPHKKFNVGSFPRLD